MSGSRLAAVFLLVSAGVLSAQKNAVYATVSGTVFRDPGLALPEAKVVLQPRDDPKARKQEAITNYRGEFLFRVPAKETVYVVKASMKGYRPDQKEAAISGEERIDVNLVLIPDAK